MATLRSVLVVLALLVTSSLMIGLVSSTASPSPDSNSSTAIPEDGPDYGVNETQFPLLWSEATNQENLSSDEFDEDVSSPEEFSQRLSQSTDFLFEEPVEDVELWNSGDFADFSAGDEETAVHPETAELEDGRYIKDAHASIFAVQPSTVLQSGNESPTYIAAEGEVLATTDYRVQVPEDNESGPVREEWSIDETDIESVDLLADGQLIDSNESHRSTLEYSDLSGDPTLTTEMEISAQLRHEERTCDDYNSSTDSCDGSWETEITYPSEDVTATESRQTVVNQLENVNGSRTAFEADDGCHTMVSRTETDTTRENSSVRPAQIYAIPYQAEPDMPSEATDTAEPPLVIEEAWGSEHVGPSLPDEIDITPTDHYVNATSVALQSETLSASTFDEVTVHGIVRGQSQSVSLEEEGTVRETSLELTVLEDGCRSRSHGKCNWRASNDWAGRSWQPVGCRQRQWDGPPPSRGAAVVTC